MDANRFRTHTLQDPRILQILAAVLDAVEPQKIVGDFLLDNILPDHKRLFLLGIGKAAEPMTLAAANILTHFTDALIITKFASGRTLRLRSGQACERVTIMEAGHPIPDERSLAAGQAALKFVSQLNEDDLLVCLISGGGSALVTSPSDGLTLEDMRELTSALLSSGATINEINLIRRKLDNVKGGGLARATKAKIVSLILSDVLGNPLEAIASGPTGPDRSTKEDAIANLKKYDLLTEKFSGTIKEKSFDNFPFDRVENFIVGDIHVAEQAALEQAKRSGFDAEILSLNIQGEAREVGSQFAKKLKEERRKKQHPFCFIAGGETTVTLRGNGKGGRNQELALAVVDELSGVENILLVALATDGDDGPTDAAGAVVNGESRQRAERLGMFASAYLSRNDAYPYFQQLNDLIKSGYSGTNVNDLIFLFGL